MTKASRRFHRTLFLGLAALAVLVWTAIDQFGISRQEMANLFLGTVLAAAGTILFAGVCVGAWIGLRKLLHGRNLD